MASIKTPGLPSAELVPMKTVPIPAYDAEPAFAEPVDQTSVAIPQKPISTGVITGEEAWAMFSKVPFEPALS